MHRTILIAILSPVLLGSCLPDFQEVPHPVNLTDKKIVFEFFTDRDYSAADFDNHFIKLNVEVFVIHKKTGFENKELSESTAWMAFRDIPREDQKAVYEKLLQKVDIEKFKVVYGYSYQVKIGETIQMHAKSDFLNPWENARFVQIKI